MNERSSRPAGVGWTPDLVLANAFAVAGSGLALTGVLAWGWDAFQLLVLYWCETGIAAFWALTKLWFLPPKMLGTMVVNRKTVPATNGTLVLMFAITFGVFLVCHLAVLWVYFSSGSAAAVSGPASFVREMVVASWAWAPLLLAWLAGGIDFLRIPKRESLLLTIERRLYPSRSFAADTGDGVGPAIATPLFRIVAMQVAVIFGAMLVRTFGTNTPFYILIGLKALMDLRRPEPPRA